jgi:hypothetical protein
MASWFDNILSRRAYINLRHEHVLDEHKHLQRSILARFQSAGRPIWVHPHEGIDAKWGVEPLLTPPTHKKLLVTGTGRCGTTYLSRLLQMIGVDAPHGKVGKDGTTSHYFMVDHYWYPMITYNPAFVAHIGERASDFAFEKAIYLVREPLSTIRSLSIFFGKIDELFYEEAGIVPRDTFKQHNHLLWRGMVLYYYVNKWILEHYPVHLLIHMEDLKRLATWDTLLDYIGQEYVAMPNLPAQNKMGELTFTTLEKKVRRFYGEETFMKGYDAFPRDVTYADLAGLDNDMTRKVISISAHLGYLEQLWS